MAADLTPRFRRLNSQTRSIRENGQIGFSGPFHATQLWKNIIQALQTQVEVRPRRLHLRTHADCFTGSDAVDAVLSHLMQDVFFCSNEISRLKATRLCQAFMEAKVFEPVGTRLFRREKEATFEDSSCSLYRFLDCDALPGSMKCGNMENETPDVPKGKRKIHRDQLRTFSNPLASEASDRRVERLLRTINLRPSMPSDRPVAAVSSALPKRVVEEVWKQHTLLQLLQIVELPVLDGILTSTAQLEPQERVLLSNCQDLVIPNSFVDKEVIQSLNLPQLDPWLVAAADCLEHFPDQLIVVAGEHLLQQGGAVAQGGGTLATTKRVLFDIIAKHYNGQDRKALISGHYLDIHVAILHLLAEAKPESALSASQLCLQLMGPGDRDELRRLLSFMATASHPDACRLHKQTNNQSFVSRTFQKAIVQSKDLSRAQSERLVVFLMDNHERLFKTPASLIKMVSKTLQCLQQGRDLDAIPTFAFCQRVTVQQYEAQRDTATQESLKQLIRNVSLSATLPFKDRRRLMRDFQKHHPVVFLQHFATTIE
ncbi:DEP domain-containing protein 4 isoform X2 [Brienomyrus brachyistius]|uniref:DEP domain-containing protein 4 isoform X2 n=1 Tax=Brienomyrus brachyistius TaxID=42636 RepID=UPI0020B3E0A2|nr:DEP domain-containing protein 4 isoform X2 [Brienomyrus brachyistius]